MTRNADAATRGRHVLRASAVVALLAATLSLTTAASVGATPDPCTVPGDTCTVTYTGSTSAPTATTFVVPTGVTSLSVAVIGGEGTTVGGSFAGAADVIDASIAVTAGTTFTVDVQGAQGPVIPCGYTGNPQASSAVYAGQGGGAAWITQNGSSNEIVAGGGGGAGCPSYLYPTTYPGGNGGNAGTFQYSSSGGAGVSPALDTTDAGCGTDSPASGGSGGTTSAGGAGGTADGQAAGGNGSAYAGGAASTVGSVIGGSGGAGYDGGGAGGNGGNCTGGGGGGGGMSYINGFTPSFENQEFESSPDSSASISYTVPSPTVAVNVNCDTTSSTNAPSLATPTTVDVAPGDYVQLTSAASTTCDDLVNVGGATLANVVGPADPTASALPTTVTDYPITTPFTLRISPTASPGSYASLLFMSSNVLNGGLGDHGEDLVFDVAGTPSASAVTATATETTATLSATVATNGDPLTTDEFCYSTTPFTAGNCTGTTVAASGTTTAPTATLTSLSPNTTYDVEAIALNAVGVASDGAVVSFQTETPASVTTAAATAVSSTSATLNGTITANTDSGTGSAVFCYSTSSVTTNGLLPCSDEIAATAAGSGNEDAALTGLTGSTTYFFQLQYTNDDGSVSFGAVDQLTTSSPASAPATPAAPTLTPGNAQLSVSWSAPSNNGATIDYYEVQIAPVSSGTYAPPSAGTCTGTGNNLEVTTTSCTITGLTNATTYEVAVEAHNADGFSSFSSPTSATPTAPSGPTSVTTATSLNLSRASVAVGDENDLVLTGTVTGQRADGTPEGAVTVSSGATTVCSATLTPARSGVSSFACSPSATALGAGTYTNLIATYVPGTPSSTNASDAYETSSSRPVTLRVNAPSVLVTFAANGGRGTMSPESFTVGQSQALSLNRFTRAGYQFAGWARTSTGPVAYANGQAVTVSSAMTLFAVWVRSR